MCSICKCVLTVTAINISTRFFLQIIHIWAFYNSQSDFILFRLKVPGSSLAVLSDIRNREKRAGIEDDNF